jgi:hypothetical protein
VMTSVMAVVGVVRVVVLHRDRGLGGPCSYGVSSAVCILRWIKYARQWLAAIAISRGRSGRSPPAGTKRLRAPEAPVRE